MWDGMLLWVLPARLPFDRAMLIVVVMPRNVKRY